MNLQKRDCPIIIRVLPGGAGWTDIEWFVPAMMSEPLTLTASDIGRLFGDFVRALYYLYPDQTATGRGYNIVEYKSAAYDWETGKHGRLYDAEESLPAGTYIEIPFKATFCWEEEPGGSTWTLTREPTADTVFTVELNLAVDRYRDGNEQHLEYNYQFEYQDLCYAVAKAMTEVLKDYGFHGYPYSTSDNGISVHELLFLKAIALDCLEAYELKSRGEYARASDFEKEMELLLFDM